MQYSNENEQLKKRAQHANIFEEDIQKLRSEVERLNHVV